jgi:hypothetical protein
MAASDNLHPVLFHGTAGRIKGGKLRPHDGFYGKGVYSVDDLKTAEGYAMEKAFTSDIDKETGLPDGKTTRPLFATVYEVDPTESEYVDQSMAGDYYMSKTPTKVKRAVSFPNVPYPGNHLR